MRYLFLLVLLFSCSKTVEDNCFKEKEEEITYTEEKPYTVKQILDSKPDYLEIIDLKNYRPFKRDSIENQYHSEDQKLEETNRKKREEEYKDFIKVFHDQFSFNSKQVIGNSQYCLGRNRLGYWLLTIENDRSFAYFLGLSFSHYYINKIQEKPIVNNDFLELEGSFVKIVTVPDLPSYDDYSSISDGKLFKMKLSDLMKDSDQDGYNDIFENCFGLNPQNKDTDGDGVDDFNDLNPMFISEKNKFSQLYEELLPDYGKVDSSEKNYFFEVFETDCDYFHQIKPKYHVLFVPNDSELKTDYLKITDVIENGISKIQINKNNPNTFYITEWGNSSSTIYSAEYHNGKWFLTREGGYVI